MLRRGDRIVIASHNAGKVKEFAELFAPFGIETVSASELDLPEPEETGKSFVDNAKLKAIAAAKASGLPALADDSGLEVAALGGEPGIHSARWGGRAKDFGVAMARVDSELTATGASNRDANFTCALALAAPDGSAQMFEGKVFGTVVWPPRGARGFGYDPVFVPDGYDETFGEMEPGLKDAISHRAHAFEKLMLAVYDDDG
ncbi:MAG: RdgB/HAM1 family non-canonical purine NTP pyrophosphatase [Methyloceanibacter sp.]|jgi:XTP/dITP diphosphohydrolase